VIAAIESHWGTCSVVSLLPLSLSAMDKKNEQESYLFSAFFSPAHHIFGGAEDF